MSRIRTIEVQVSGKVILSGEHSVVYGFPALACSLHRGLTAHFTLDLDSVSSSTSSMPTLFLQHFNLNCTPFEKEGDPAFSLSQAFHTALNWVGKALKLPHPLTRAPLSIKMSGPLPFQVGLGSSAALSVALIKGLGMIYGHNFNEFELNQGVLELEKVFHGQPSGLDQSVIIQGGVIGFKKDESSESNLDSSPYALTPLTLSHPFNLVLSWIPRQGQTADAVRLVRQRLSENPKLKQTLSHMGTLTQSIKTSCLKGDFQHMGHLFNQNHQALIELGVSLPELNQMQSLACEAGAWGAKLTGAGLGGCVIALCDTQEQADLVENTFKSHHYPTWQTWIMT